MDRLTKPSDLGAIYGLTPDEMELVVKSGVLPLTDTDQGLLVAEADWESFLREALLHHAGIGREVTSRSA